MSKVTSMSEFHNDGRLRSPKEALEDAISMIESDGENAFTEGNKVLILALDDTNDSFTVNWVQAGMKMSQCLALLEIAKMEILSEMNYI